MADRKTTEQICSNCGETFIYRLSEKKFPPSFCPLCLNTMKKARAQEEEEKRQKIEDEQWRKQQIINHKKFEDKLKNLPVIDLKNIHVNSHTLYIIGNGFDLMHGVKSSYGSFRDSLGKNSSLRLRLELYLKSEDIWADFENALGHINMDMMANPNMVGDMLDLSGFFDEDAGAAEYFMGIEMAAEPMRSIVEELEKRFGNWIAGLSVGTDDRPLKSLFHDDKVLCFNYTEFVEDLYGVAASNVCYIHGCRRKKKGKPREKLVLGHMPGASESEYALIRNLKRKKSYRSQVIDAAQDQVLDLLARFDDELTKDSQAIIKNHSSFFEGLSDMENIVVIGHSLSPVDWDYFLEVAKNAPDAKWYFGCHGIYDCENMEKLVNILGIDYSVFRTDLISVDRYPEPVKIIPAGSGQKVFESASPDRRWNAKWSGKKLEITGTGSLLKRIMFGNIKRCVFSPDSDILFLVLDCLDAGILFFRFLDGEWIYIDEMETIPHQNLLNRRLNYIYLDSKNITFVYNNKFRVYSLETGALIKIQAQKNAKDRKYQGTEISNLFLRQNLAK